jgi:tetratricopeptide (TPR) repeat protein
VGSRNPFIVYSTVMFLLALVFLFFLGPTAFGMNGNWWVGAGLVLFVLAVMVVSLLCRPSVRHSLAMMRLFFKGYRATTSARYDDAEQLYRQAIALAEQGTGNRDYQIGMSLSKLAEVYRAQGRLSDAEPIAAQSRRHFDAMEPPNPLQRVVGMNNLAIVWLNQGRCDEAEHLLREVVAHIEKAFGLAHPNTAIARANLALAIVYQGRVAEAEALLQTARPLLMKRIARRNPACIVVLGVMTEVFRRQGRLAEAETAAREAVAGMEWAPTGSEHPSLARYLGSLAEVLRLRGNTEEAEALCLRARRLLERPFPDHFGVDACLAPLARLNASRANFQEADVLFRRCLEVLDREVVPEHPERVLRMEEYAGLLRQMGRGAEAESWEAKAKAMPVWAIHKSTKAERA